MTDKKKDFEEILEIPARWTKARKEKFMREFLETAREIETREKIRARRNGSRPGTLSPNTVNYSDVKGVSAYTVPELAFHGISEHDASSVAQAVLSALLSDLGYDDLQSLEALGTGFLDDSEDEL